MASLLLWRAVAQVLRVTRNSDAAQPCLSFPDGVVIVGGGPIGPQDLRLASALAGGLVCADGGANHLNGQRPDAIIGDMDSLADAAHWQASLGDQLVHVAEQDTTDFEKCLSRVSAPFAIGVGFLGGRIDHELAALHSLIAAPLPVVLLGAEDVIIAAGTGLHLMLEPGDRVSVFPLLPVRGIASKGLHWPITGLDMAAGRQVGTSNRASDATVEMAFDQPGAIVILPRDRLGAALTAIGVSPQAAVP